MYKGIVIKESLINPNILSDFKTFKTVVDDDWHLLWVEVDDKGLETIKNNLIDPSWYAHFASGNTGFVIFKDKTFEMNIDDRQTWLDAKKHGKSVGIPDEQLDFEFSDFV